MSIVSVVLKKASLEGKGTLEGERTYKKVFIVITNSDADGPMVVSLATGIPRKGDVYVIGTETDAGALCQDINVVQDRENARVWTVTANYSSKSGDPAGDKEDPMIRPPDVSWGSWSEMEVPHEDRNGKPFTNSFGSPLDPPFERKLRFPALTVVRNEATFPIGIVRAYWESVNSDEFNGWPAGTAKVEDIRAVSAFEEATSFFRVTYEILFKEPDWIHRALDQGPRHWKDVAAPEKIEVYATDDFGQPSTHPVLLDGAGGRLSKAQVAAGDFHVLDFDLFEPMLFADLNL